MNRKIYYQNVLWHNIKRKERVVISSLIIIQGIYEKILY